ANVLRGVVVGVNLVPALLAGKVGLGGAVVPCRVAASRASVAGVLWWHFRHVDTDRFGLVLDVSVQLVECPRVEFLGSRHPFADAVQPLESDGRTAVLNGFGD